MYLNKNIYWMTPKTCVYLRPGIQGDDNLGSMLVKELRGTESTQDACAKIRVSANS
jgi:hypothetical protein